MSKITITIAVTTLFFIVGHAQYSNYYNINANVTGVHFEHKTIRTIDYGALQMANAQREKNRIERQRFENERQRQIAIEISENPIKAYDYGKWFTISSKDKWWKQNKYLVEYFKELKKSKRINEFRLSYVMPGDIFTMLDPFYLQNLGSDGTKTDIKIYLPAYIKGGLAQDIEDAFENNIIVGMEFEKVDIDNKTRKAIYHKKEMNRAIIYGIKGFRVTYAWEDNLEIGITENYLFDQDYNGDTLSVNIVVEYYGNKSEIDFEELEGRRFYLKPLIEKIISTASFRL